MDCSAGRRRARPIVAVVRHGGTRALRARRRRHDAPTARSADRDHVERARGRRRCGRAHRATAPRRVHGRRTGLRFHPDAPGNVPRRDRCALEFPPRISGAGADCAGAAGPAARRRPVRRARARPRSSLRAVDAQWRGVARARRSRKRDSVDYRAHRRAGDRAAARTAAPRRGERSRRGSHAGRSRVAAQDCERSSRHGGVHAWRSVSRAQATGRSGHRGPRRLGRRSDDRRRRLQYMDGRRGTGDCDRAESLSGSIDHRRPTRDVDWDAWTSRAARLRVRARRQGNRGTAPAAAFRI